MSYYLGIDTSNYTTSVAIYDSDNKSVINKKMLLPVKNGEKGIRQSDAVFHHTIQLPKLFRELFDEIDLKFLEEKNKEENIEATLNFNQTIGLECVEVAENFDKNNSTRTITFTIKENNINKEKTSAANFLG